MVRLKIKIFTIFIFTFLSASLCTSVFFTQAYACQALVKVSYYEESPDIFVIERSKENEARLISIKIDLSTSLGRAFVDTFYERSPSYDPKGVELETIEGFQEGGKSGLLKFKRFLPGQKFTLRIDLDPADPIGHGNYNRLMNGEIGNAKAEAQLIAPDGTPLKIYGAFNREGVAELHFGPCV